MCVNEIAFEDNYLFFLIICLVNAILLPCPFCVRYFARSYLSVVSGVISEADYIFCPESPPPVDWPERLCDKLTQARQKHFETPHKSQHIKPRETVSSS